MIRCFLDALFLHLSAPPEREIGHCITQRLASEIDTLREEVERLSYEVVRRTEERDTVIAQRDAAWRRLDERNANVG